VINEAATVIRRKSPRLTFTQVGEDLARAAVELAVLGLAHYVAYILHRGIKTDKYAPLPEIDVMDASSAVVDAFANEIPKDRGIVVDDDQHYPVFGWIEAKWSGG
jgi:hypothetical protein